MKYVQIGIVGNKECMGKSCTDNVILFIPLLLAFFALYYLYHVTLYNQRNGREKFNFIDTFVLITSKN